MAWHVRLSESLNLVERRSPTGGQGRAWARPWKSGAGQEVLRRKGDWLWPGLGEDSDGTANLGLSTRREVGERKCFERESGTFPEVYYQVLSIC